MEYTLSGVQGNVTQQNYSVDDLETSNETFNVIISELNSFREYTVSIRAFTRVGPGDSRSQRVRTDPAAPSEPTNVMATALNSTSISLTWSYPDQPNGPILGYIINTNATTNIFESSENVVIVPGGIFNITLAMLNDSSDQSLVVAGLSPFTVYSFRVQALTLQLPDNNSDFFIHEGLFSMEVTATTDEGGESNGYIYYYYSNYNSIYTAFHSAKCSSELHTRECS